MAVTALNVCVQYNVGLCDIGLNVIALNGLSILVLLSTESIPTLECCILSQAKVTIFWAVKPCILAHEYQNFSGINTSEESLIT